jgi:tellurite resistance protein
MSDLLRAAARAYALMCYADGRLAPAEQARFAAYLKSEDAFASCADTDIETTWKQAFRDVWRDGGYGPSLPVIAAAAVDEPARDLMLRAARAALVADHVLAPQEEGALAAIAMALGRAPEAC